MSQINHPNEINIKISFPDTGGEISQSIPASQAGTDASPAPPGIDDNSENTIEAGDNNLAPPSAGDETDADVASASDETAPPPDNSDSDSSPVEGIRPPDDDEQSAEEMADDMPPPED